MKKFNLLLAILMMMCTFQFTAKAQEAIKPRKSPLGLVTFKYENTYMKVTYGRPQKRGREIFGDNTLVPFGKVWRLGANEATELTTTHEVMMAGHKVPAGTYTVFAIPEADHWTIILNSVLGQWGAFDYDKSKDVLRFDVPVEKSDTMYEPFTILFEHEKGNNKASLVMVWDTTKVSIPITFEG